MKYYEAIGFTNTADLVRFYAAEPEEATRGFIAKYGNPCAHPRLIEEDIASAVFRLQNGDMAPEKRASLALFYGGKRATVNNARWPDPVPIMRTGWYFKVDFSFLDDGYPSDPSILSP